MSRLPRICPIGIAKHIIQRGNSRQICFDCEQFFLLMWVG
jgi:putative transposase